MSRSGAVLAVGAILGLSGCKVPGTPPNAPGESMPGLLVGPEGAGKPPAVELPPRDAAKTCLQTALAYEKGGQVEEAIRLYERARARYASALAQSPRP